MSERVRQIGDDDPFRLATQRVHHGHKKKREKEVLLSFSKF